MQESDKKPHPEQPELQPPSAALGDASGVNVSGYVRIHDPNTQETLVEARE